MEVIKKCEIIQRIQCRPAQSYQPRKRTKEKDRLGKVKLSKLGRLGPCGNSRDPVTPALMQTTGGHFSAVHIDPETIV